MTHEHESVSRSSRPVPGRASGVVLALGAIVMLVFMALHPTTHVHNAPGFLTRNLSGIVHGTLIGAMGLLALGLLGFAERLGPHRMAVRAGFIAYAIGTVAHTGAATVNGFIVPGLVGAYAGASPHADHGALTEQLRPLLLLCREVNGSAARLGVVAMSIAVVLWSLVLVRRPGAARAIGVLGLICGLIPPVLLAGNLLPMNVQGFRVRVIVQAIWYLAVSVQLIRGRI